VTTSVAVVCRAEGYEKVLVDSGFVYFKPYDASSVEAYLATGDHKDKAGAYAIFNTRHMIEKIEGDEETIIGLPTALLKELLLPFDVS
jgi:septum formation protein